MKSKNVSFGGIMAALSLLLLYIAGVVPTGRFAFIAASSYAVGVCVAVAGIKLSVVAYVAITVLSFVLIPDKSIAVLFAVFFGNYPIVKLFIEKIHRLYPEWIVKITVFNIYAIVMWFVVKQFTVVEFGFALPVVWLILNIVFVIYDIVFNIVVTKILILRRGKNL